MRGGIADRMRRGRQKLLAGQDSTLQCRVKLVADLDTIMIMYREYMDVHNTEYFLIWTINGLRDSLADLE